MHRSRPTRITATVVTVAVIAVLVVLVVSHARTRRQDAMAGTHGASNAPTVHTDDATPHPFSLRGEVDGLYPSATRTLAVRVDNPNAIPLRVTTVAVTVHDASPRCLATNLATSGFSGALVVPARGSDSIGVTVRMARTAPDACQDATFPLTLSAQAAKA
ncbi:MAG TPA: hypothetical protein VFC33_02175 [Acidimicrobiia bacterium]|nr:hypothetical protein [Acidimicrobiia bacterium]